MKIEILLDQARSVANIPSDLQLAKTLGVSQTAVWKWRKGDDLPKPEYAYELAILAGLNPAEIVAEVLKMGSKTASLRAIYEQFKSAVAACFCLSIALPSIIQAAAQGILC